MMDSCASVCVADTLACGKCIQPVSISCVASTLDEYTSET